MIKFENLILDVRKLIIRRLNQHDCKILKFVSKEFNKLSNLSVIKRSSFKFMSYLIHNKYLNLIKFLHIKLKFDHLLLNLVLLDRINNIIPLKKITNTNKWIYWLTWHAALCDNLEILKWLHQNHYPCIIDMKTIIWVNNRTIINYLVNNKCMCIRPWKIHH